MFIKSNLSFKRNKFQNIKLKIFLNITDPRKAFFSPCFETKKKKKIV